MNITQQVTYYSALIASPIKSAMSEAEPKSRSGEESELVATDIS